VREVRVVDRRRLGVFASLVHFAEMFVDQSSTYPQTSTFTQKKTRTREEEEEEKEEEEEEKQEEEEEEEKKEEEKKKRKKKNKNKKNKNKNKNKNNNKNKKNKKKQQQQQQQQQQPWTFYVERLYWCYVVELCAKFDRNRGEIIEDVANVLPCCIILWPWYLTPWPWTLLSYIGCHMIGFCSKLEREGTIRGRVIEHL